MLILTPGGGVRGIQDHASGPLRPGQAGHRRPDHGRKGPGGPAGIDRAWLDGDMGSVPRHQELSVFFSHAVIGLGSADRTSTLTIVRAGEGNESFTSTKEHVHAGSEPAERIYPAHSNDASGLDGGSVCGWEGRCRADSFAFCVAGTGDL